MTRYIPHALLCLYGAAMTGMFLWAATLPPRPVTPDGQRCLNAMAVQARVEEWESKRPVHVVKVACAIR